MATLTLRNVPDELYDEIKAAAARNRRSLNQEAISRLETTIEDSNGSSDPFDAIRPFVQELADRGFWTDAEEIERLINEGHD